MKQLVMDASYNHPAHLFILDPADRNWLKYFTAEELEEIETCDIKQFEPIPKELQQYLDSYDQNWTTGEDLCRFAENQGFISFSEFDKRWIRNSMVEPFVYKAFGDNGVIQAKLGERNSVAVSLGRNKDRGIEFDNRRQRKTAGAKLDILFKAPNNSELGSSEVGRDNVTTADDKYFDEGLVKLPKTLRDMLSQLVRKNPKQINKLSTIGFLIMGNSLEISRMDVPKGSYITRISRAATFDFPSSVYDISSDFIPLLELTWKAKNSMLDNVKLLHDRKRKAAELLGSNITNSSLLLHPSFVRSSSSSEE